MDSSLLPTQYLNGNNMPDVVDGTGTIADESSVNCRLQKKDDGKIDPHIDRIVVVVADIKSSHHQ